MRWFDAFTVLHEDFSQILSKCVDMRNGKFCKKYAIMKEKSANIDG